MDHSSGLDRLGPVHRHHTLPRLQSDRLVDLALHFRLFTSLDAIFCHFRPSKVAKSGLPTFQKLFLQRKFDQDLGHFEELCPDLLEL